MRRAACGAPPRTRNGRWPEACRSWCGCRSALLPAPDRTRAQALDRPAGRQGPPRPNVCAPESSAMPWHKTATIPVHPAGTLPVRDLVSRRFGPVTGEISKIGVLGAQGKVGAEMCKAVDAADGFPPVAALDAGGDISALVGIGAQAVVDLTHPAVVMANLGFCIQHGTRSEEGRVGK